MQINVRVGCKIRAEMSLHLVEVLEGADTADISSVLELKPESVYESGKEYSPGKRVNMSSIPRGPRQVEGVQC